MEDAQGLGGFGWTSGFRLWGGFKGRAPCFGEAGPAPKLDPAPNNSKRSAKKRTEFRLVF